MIEVWQKVIFEGQGADMEKFPLISIIIPVYNVEQYLDECMESVLNQTYANLEVVLVDDGSKDRSPKMCDDYAKKDARVQVIHKENGGPMSACIAGVEKAKGEYFAFMDSDDWVDLTMLEELAKEITGKDKEMVCSNYVIEKASGSIKIKQSMKPGVYDRKAIEEELFPCLLGKEERRIHGSRCMKLISKRLISENLKFAELNVSMGEDLYLIFLAVLDAERIVVVEDGYYYHYRFVESSLVHKYKPHMHEEVGRLYDNLQRVIETKVISEKQREMFLEELKKEFIFLFFFVLKNELRGPAENCAGRIQKYIKKEKKSKDLESISVEVSGKANKLLYLIWKKPSSFRIVLVRLIINIFDKL